MAQTLIIGAHAVGMRVELHPGMDAWMAGDRYGTIVKVTRQRIHVRLDKSGRTLRLLPDGFTFID